MFAICCFKFSKPAATASTFSPLRSFLSTPPCIFNALTVATITTIFGFKLPFLHLISKNFSAPKSAPNPASVTTKSDSFKAVWVATNELHPCAIFAKGPP